MSLMLINATHLEEVRVVIANGTRIEHLDFENMGNMLQKGNVCLAEVKNIEPSLNAAFVDYGAGRHGFLSLKEVAKEYWPAGSGDEAFQENNDAAPRHGQRKTIKDVLKVGQKILVQVEKDERGTKGAALTTFITLAGCYLVLMPNNPRAGGISRRIEGDEREELKDALECLQVPDGMGIIIRTAGVGRAPEELQWDLAVLLKRWEDIQNAAKTVEAPAMIHQERDIIARAIRDHLRDDVTEILIDNPTYFEKAKYYIERLRPELSDRLKLYQDKIPLFSRYQIESQIEAAFSREVRLPSGGALVIDHTEAVVTIDVNSARSTRAGDIEETALHTNLQAADEIARQLALRDLGGLIVIDFIDMTPIANQKAVENRLREALRADRARIQIGRISRFGLLEMSRQRLRSSLGETVHQSCPRCNGQGHIRSIESLSLSIIRMIEEEAMKDHTAEVHAALPIEVATFLANEKRTMLIELEARHHVKVLVMPVAEIQSPHYQIRRIRGDEAGSHEMTSAQLAKDMAMRGAEQMTTQHSTRPPAQTPIVEFLSQVKPREPSLIQKSVQGISQLIKSVFKPTETHSKTEAQSSSRRSSSDRPARGGNQRGRYGKRRGPHEGNGQQGQNPRRSQGHSGQFSNEGNSERSEQRPRRHESELGDNKHHRHDQRPRRHGQHAEGSNGHRNRTRTAPAAHPHHAEPIAAHEAPVAQDELLDQEPPMPMHHTAAPAHESGEGRRGSGHHRRGHRGPRGGNNHHQGRRQHPGRQQGASQEGQAIPYETHMEPAPLLSFDLEEGPPPSVTQAFNPPASHAAVHEEHEAQPLSNESAVIANLQKEARRRPSSYKVPVVDSPLMRSNAPLQDVTQMNVAAGESSGVSQGESAEATGSQPAHSARRYPRRRTNHLRSQQRGNGDKAPE